MALLWKVMGMGKIEMEKAANILKLLGDKTRLTMVKILNSHDCCVCEFVAMFQMSQPAISQHMRKLKDAGIVGETKRGQWVIYSLIKNGDMYPFVQAILDNLPDQEYRLQQLEEKGLRISCD